MGAIASLIPFAITTSGNKLRLQRKLIYSSSLQKTFWLRGRPTVEKYTIAYIVLTFEKPIFFVAKLIIITTDG